MTKRKAKTETAVAAPIEKVVAFKAFDADFKCRGFQYEVGQTYKQDKPAVICERGFHACEIGLDVWRYYESSATRYAEVELIGPVVRHDEDSKVASAEIAIKAELKLPDFIRQATAHLVKWITSKADSNIATGYSGHAAATGDSGHAAATGNSGHAAATGYSGIAASLGYAGTASAGQSGAIMLAAYDDDWNIVAVFASKVGENGIEAGKTYRLGTDGKPVEVTP